MKTFDCPRTLYYQVGERVHLCRNPTRNCDHSHHYFLAVAAREAFKHFQRGYHIHSNGEIERCVIGKSNCERPQHFEARRDVVSFHKSNYDFSGPWRARVNPYVSFLESEVADFVQCLPYKVILNSRKVIGPSELDVYLPSRGVALEFNGDFWHSEKSIEARYRKSSRSYHESKFERCYYQGIALGFVWESNWIQSPETIVDTVSDLVQYKRNSMILKQFSKPLNTSDVFWESVDRNSMLSHRLKVEKRLKKRWRVS